MKPTAFFPTTILIAGMLALLAGAGAAPKIVLISLDGATPRLVDQYLASGALPPHEGLGLLQAKGFRARINETVSPSLTAVGHIAIATGSKAAKNDIIANTFHLVASPFSFNISGFGAPIGGYCIDCGPMGGPGETPLPTSEPVWLRLRAAGKKVVTATWPGGDGVDVRVPGASNNAIVQGSAERTVDYTIPFGAFSPLIGVPGNGAQGFQIGAADFVAAPMTTVDQLRVAGKTSFSPVLQKTTFLETFATGGATNRISLAALDTSNDSVVNYDTLVFWDDATGIQPGPFAPPHTGPAYVKASEKRGGDFFIEGSANKAGCAYYVSRLEPDLSVVRISRTSANFIPRNAAVIADVDDINNHVGFWAPQSDFRIVERISPGYATFPDIELEEIYADRVRAFTDYQARIALRAISRVPDADLVMIYFEQPDGSGHQFLLTDPRQPTDFFNPNSIGAGQDPAKVARYAKYLEVAYQAANAGVQRIINAVGVDADGKPNANVIVTSDHGFEIFHTAVNMNALLAANGIPSSKARAVTSGPAVNLYINLQGREPNGTVSRAEFVVLQQQLVSLLQGFGDVNPAYTLGVPSVPVFDKIYPRPLPPDINDASFGRGTSEFVGQDSGDVHALLIVGYNFDGVQSPVLIRQGDTAPAPPAAPIFSLPNFYGAHGYDPTLPNLSSILYAAGPDIGPGVLPLAHNVDVVPTVAAMLGVEPYAAVDGVELPIGPLRLTNAVSRKTHGPAGAFDLPLPVSGSPGVEGRKATDSGAHTLVFTFNKPLTTANALVIAGRGVVSGAASVVGQQVIINLSSVHDAQLVTLSLTGVTDVYGGTAATTFSFGVLWGDVDGTGIVTEADLDAVTTAAEAGGTVNEATFRLDVNVSGKINNADIVQTRNRRAQAEL